MTVRYEWDVELYATADSAAFDQYDVIDHNHCANVREIPYALSRPLGEGEGHRVVLVRDDDDGRAWAFLGDDGTLPQFADDAYDVPQGKVPSRFHAQAAWLKAYAKEHAIDLATV